MASVNNPLIRGRILAPALYLKLAMAMITTMKRIKMVKIFCSVSGWDCGLAVWVQSFFQLVAELFCIEVVIFSFQF